MHGDIALAEAQGSLEAFFHLVGVRPSLTIASGPTSATRPTTTPPSGRRRPAADLQLMFEALAAEVRRRKVRVFDGHEVIALLTDGKGASKG